MSDITILEPTFTIAGVVEIIDNAIPNVEHVLAAIDDAADWEQARVGRTATEHVDVATRSNRVFGFNPFDLRIATPLYEFARLVWHYLDDYATRYDFGFTQLEPVNINRYEPGQHYSAHADAGLDVPRVVSALVYLNDVAEGGETEFVYFDEKVAPQAGRLVLFPSNYAYTHAALPPASGVKYSAAFWARG